MVIQADARDTEEARTLHVIFGTGPVGCSAADALLEGGIGCVWLTDAVNLRSVHSSSSRPNIGPAWSSFPLTQETCRQSAVPPVKRRMPTTASTCPTRTDWHEIPPVMHANILRAATENGAVLATSENLYTRSTFPSSMMVLG